MAINAATASIAPVIVEVDDDAPITPGEMRHFKSLERRIEDGLRTFREVGQALLEIRDSRLYRAEFTSFDEYCQTRWKMERARAYQLMSGAEVARVVEDPALTNELQARALTPLLDRPDELKQVWSEIKSSGQAITARVVSQAVQNHVSPGTIKAEPTASERLADDVLKLAAKTARWNESRPGRRDKGIVTAAFRKLYEVSPKAE